MEWRNAKYNKHGTIDMEVDHPTYGWIPFTADPNDSLEHGRELYQQALDSGEVGDCVISPQELQSMVVAYVQNALDEFAQTKSYDNILSACTYATSNIPQFAAEGQRAVDIRDEMWATLYQLLEEIQTGVRPIPASLEEIASGLPALVW